MEGRRKFLGLGFAGLCGVAARGHNADAKAASMQPIDLEPEQGLIADDWYNKFIVHCLLFSPEYINRSVMMLAYPSISIRARAVFCEHDLRTDERTLVVRTFMGKGSDATRLFAAEKKTQSLPHWSMKELSPVLGSLDATIEEKRVPIGGQIVALLGEAWTAALLRTRYATKSSLVQDAEIFYFFHPDRGRMFTGQAINPSNDTVAGRLVAIGEQMMSLVDEHESSLPSALKGTEATAHRFLADIARLPRI